MTTYPYRTGHYQHIGRSIDALRFGVRVDLERDGRVSMPGASSHGFRSGAARVGE